MLLCLVGEEKRIEERSAGDVSRERRTRVTIKREKHCQSAIEGLKAMSTDDAVPTWPLRVRRTATVL